MNNLVMQFAQVTIGEVLAHLPMLHAFTCMLLLKVLKITTFAGWILKRRNDQHGYCQTGRGVQTQTDIS